MNWRLIFHHNCLKKWGPVIVVVLVLLIPSTKHKLFKKCDLKPDPLSLCRFAGQPKRENQLSSNALATVFASWLWSGIASYPFENWSPSDSGSGPMISNATCQNGWLGFHVSSGCFCFWLGFFFAMHISQLLLDLCLAVFVSIWPLSQLMERAPFWYTYLHHLDILLLVLAAVFLSVASMLIASVIEKEFFTFNQKFVRWSRCFFKPFKTISIEPNES